MQDWKREVTEDMLPEAHRKIAEVIGVEATLQLCEAWGGLPVYIPKIDAVQSAVRAQQIRDEYNGYNVPQLARKHGLTSRMIYQIVNGAPIAQIDGQMGIDDLMGDAENL